MNAEQCARLDRVVRSVCKDFDAGRLDTLTIDGRDALDKRVLRQRPVICAGFHEQAAIAADVTCFGCGIDTAIETVAVLGGKPYCQTCAPSHRQARPEKYQ
jgi:hypothetical protein